MSTQEQPLRCEICGNTYPDELVEDRTNGRGPFITCRVWCQPKPQRTAIDAGVVSGA